MRVEMSTLPHQCQPYATCGNWVLTGEGICVDVSQMHNNDYHFLVMIHELVEAYLCWKRGITQDAVDAFDIAFEANRTDDSEPGHDPSAPYHHEHVFAEYIERLVAQELGVNWGVYDRIVSDL